MITLAPPAPAIATFPVAAVEACLRGELIEAIKAEASIKGISLPTSPAEDRQNGLPGRTLSWWSPFFVRSSRSSASNFRKVLCALAVMSPWKVLLGTCCHESKRNGSRGKELSHDRFSTAARKADEEERRRLGDRLREARKYLGLKQEEVATYLKIPRTALTDIENGQRRVEAIELTRLAKLYRQPVAYFTGEDEAGANLPVDVAHLARQAADLSQQDRDELGRFAEYLRARSRAAQG